MAEFKTLGFIPNISILLAHSGLPYKTPQKDSFGLF
jgi:hypothetical protein